MTRIYEVEPVGRGDVYSLEEICLRINLEQEFIVQCVEHGIAEATGSDLNAWRFSPGEVARIQRAYRLHRDLEINFTGLGIVLDLLEDIADLRRQLNVLRKRLNHWES